MEKNTKTLLLAGASVLVLAGAGWWLLGRQKRLREEIHIRPRALLQAGGGRMIGARPPFSGQT